MFDRKTRISCQKRSPTVLYSHVPVTPTDRFRHVPISKFYLLQLTRERRYRNLKVKWNMFDNLENDGTTLVKMLPHGAFSENDELIISKYKILS